ncbi:LOW QUALITY PROTEIN: immune-associated nucleotide-binding protein 8 isoform X1 [Cinnamomum micranthum f. kanehirae]|uniref:Immune-associated nucleotide-binding protein 8 isoform X1 n=1 Tax=Cinnamomum micranthum f. kanehirae TaxID=337451 RepID=A0A3S3P085_9MAGN|nr:LOW QUALITY PROTEIN: immune-associated nucleotide-binding protein 8 isoform X1 [Cinnamomum micranthum f. kanehirae]
MEYMQFFLYTRTLFSRQEEAALQSFLKFFGAKITNYIILVFTGGDELEDNDETLAEHLGSGCPQPLKELIHQCNGRVVLFDNRTTDRTKRDNQVQQLLSMSGKIVLRQP